MAGRWLSLPPRPARLGAHDHGEHDGEHDQHAGAAPAVACPDARAQQAPRRERSKPDGESRGRTIASGTRRRRSSRARRSARARARPRRRARGSPGASRRRAATRAERRTSRCGATPRTHRAATRKPERRVAVLVERLARARSSTAGSRARLVNGRTRRSEAPATAAARTARGARPIAASQTPSGQRKNLIAPARPTASPGREAHGRGSATRARGAGRERREVRDADLADHLRPERERRRTRASRGRRRSGASAMKHAETDERDRPVGGARGRGAVKRRDEERGQRRPDQVVAVRRASEPGGGKGLSQWRSCFGLGVELVVEVGRERAVELATVANIRSRRRRAGRRRAGPAGGGARAPSPPTPRQERASDERRRSSSRRAGAPRRGRRSSATRASTSAVCHGAPLNVPVADPEPERNEPDGVESRARERERDDQQGEEVAPHDRREARAPPRSRARGSAAATRATSTPSPSASVTARAAAVGGRRGRPAARTACTRLVECVPEVAKQADVVGEADERQERGAATQPPTPTETRRPDAGRRAPARRRPARGRTSARARRRAPRPRRPPGRGSATSSARRRASGSVSVRRLVRVDHGRPEERDAVDAPVADLEHPERADEAREHERGCDPVRGLGREHRQRHDRKDGGHRPDRVRRVGDRPRPAADTGRRRSRPPPPADRAPRGSRAPDGRRRVRREREDERHERHTPSSRSSTARTAGSLGVHAATRGSGKRFGWPS